MEIKSKIHPSHHVTYVVIFALLFATLWADIPIILDVMMLALSLFASSIHFAIICRTFILDSEGCTVKMWKYQKKYKWDDFQTKRFEVGDYINKYLSYKSVVIFYKKKTRKPLWMEPYSWGMFHPLSYIFIHFESESRSKSYKIYEVNKDLLFQKLEEWGVELETHRYY